MRRLWKPLLYTLAGVGMLGTLTTLVGLVLDISAIDPTQGGYEPPYTDYVGTPIDWDELDITATGMAWRGYVFNTLVDCTTGLISFEVFKQQIPYRPLSPRALAVHRPAEACRDRGFNPEFE
ncbi:hypothetical protein [Nodosilinea sp. P-1105]|uniref:hypothetical protein n=1 Tax=Nodosilinea sp. P-1105 TaxID=2546229 RepID=UPI00146A74F5|nr:hypothetical protein [Nodosilinea sp. P-1105]NMF85844.1 hypothetical protein [Nodosilinea sp. P-1105]